MVWIQSLNDNLVNSKKLSQTIESLRFILQDTYHIDDKYFTFYEELNREMLDLLR